MDILFLKNEMTVAGLLPAPSPGVSWLEPEEKAWEKVCGLLGFPYTPYPDLALLSVDARATIHAKTFTIPRMQPPQAALLHAPDFLPMPFTLPADTPAHIIKSIKQPPQTLPREFHRRAPLRNAYDGLAPNENVPVAVPKRRAGRVNADKSKRLNAARAEETVTPVPVVPGPSRPAPNGKIRIR